MRSSRSAGEVAEPQLRSATIATRGAGRPCPAQPFAVQFSAKQYCEKAGYPYLPPTELRALYEFHIRFVEKKPMDQIRKEMKEIMLFR